MLKTLRLITTFLVSLSCVPAFSQAAKDSAPFDPAPWLEDFQQLQSEMSSHYAGLEFAITERKMDLPALRIQTEAKLRAAKDDQESRRIIEKFLASFGDGHLNVHWKSSAATTKSLEPANLCTRLGYISFLKPGLDFSNFSNFTPLNHSDGTFFSGGLLHLANDKTVGVIRIGLFSEHTYPELCEQVTKTLHLSNTDKCDDACSDKVEFAVADLLTAAVSRRASELKSAGATSLLIDITRNGGGSDWVEPAMRTLSPVPLASARLAFLKHPHWTQNLQDELKDVEADIRNGKEPKPLLAEAENKLQDAIAATKQPCSLADIWQTGKFSCSMLVRNMLYASGVLDYAKPGSYGALQSKTTLFYPLGYTYTEGTNHLPLYVLVDGGTGSAAEYFASLLQDNHAAVILGESTVGAGCGYTNGGIPTTLKNSQAELQMPDCIRFRADGSNEVNGVMPDVSVPWFRQASDYQRAVKLIPVLEKLTASQ
jgi:hypothetical protein